MRLIVFSLFVLSCFFTPTLIAEEVDCAEILCNLKEAQNQGELYTAKREEIMEKINNYNYELNVHVYANTGISLNENYTNCISSLEIDTDSCQVIRGKFWELQNKISSSYEEDFATSDKTLKSFRDIRKYLDLATECDCFDKL